MGYQGGKGNTLMTLGKGSGSLEELGIRSFTHPSHCTPSIYDCKVSGWIITLPIYLSIYSPTYLVPLLSDNIVAYGLLRKTDKIDESLTIKFVFINWVGENIDRMHRARLGTYQGAVRELFAVCLSMNEYSPSYPY